MKEKQEIQCAVDGLRRGMYVCRLDRPWIETPFPMAGFEITGDDEILQLKKFCRHVYIDIEVGPAPAPEYTAAASTKIPVASVEELPFPRGGSGAAPRRDNRQQQKYSELRKRSYEPTTQLEEEISTAQHVHQHLHAETKRVLSRLEAGYPLDVELLKENVEDTVESILRNPSALMLLVQLEKSDDYTYHHALGTSVWCAEFGRHLGLEKDEIRKLALGGMLLDVGKTRLDPGLFAKKLFFDTDRKAVRTHVERSLEILAETDGVDADIVDMVATHHERHDGTGYPHGLREDEIPLFGKIAGLVDSYDAMTTLRPYTDKILSPHQAVSQIYTWRDALFEGELIEQFIQTVGIYPAGSLVELNSGEVGVVLSINNKKRLSPSVLIMLDESKETLPAPQFIDLARSRDQRRVTRGLSPGAFGISFDEVELEAIRTF